MDYKDVIGIFEKRRDHLSKLLKHSKMTSVKESELRAALNELDIVINTLHNKRDEDFSKAYDELYAETKSEHSSNVFSKLLSPFSKKSVSGSFPE